MQVGAAFTAPSRPLRGSATGMQHSPQGRATRRPGPSGPRQAADPEARPTLRHRRGVRRDRRCWGRRQQHAKQRHVHEAIISTSAPVPAAARPVPSRLLLQPRDVPRPDDPALEQRSTDRDLSGGGARARPGCARPNAGNGAAPSISPGCRIMCAENEVCAMTVSGPTQSAASNSAAPARGHHRRSGRRTVAAGATMASVERVALGWAVTSSTSALLGSVSGKRCPDHLPRRAQPYGHVRRRVLQDPGDDAAPR